MKWVVIALAALPALAVIVWVMVAPLVKRDRGEPGV